MPKNLDGSRVGPYFIGKEIFETEDSVIYAADNSLTCQKCAVKFFKKGKRSSETIHNEVDIINEIKSPYIVQINNIYPEIHEEFDISLVMPLAKSDAYEFFIKNGHKEENIVSQAIFSVLNALQQLHGIGIIHRNISPENILIMDNYIAKNSFVLTGFSNAASFTPGQKFTEFNVGSSQYNSPEIHLKKEYDERTDLWSVGILTYVLLFQELPFPMETEEEFIESASSGKINFNGIVISDQAKDFISALLKYNASERLSINDALKHEWMKHVSTNQKEFIKPYEDIVLETIILINQINDISIEDEVNQDIPIEYEIPTNSRTKILNDQVSDSTKPTEIHNLIQKLKIIEKIGESKYYWDYKVKEESTNKIYSAKYFYENIENYNKKRQKQFRQMIRDNLLIRHPSLISNYLFKERGFDSKQCSTLVSEFNEMKPLKSINNIDLTNTHKLIIAYGISSGMSYLHDQGILHRELSISNIFVDENFYPKLANVGMFGVVKSIYDLSKIFKFLFTFPPEFYEFNKYNKKSEVFSFGILLYELFSGKNPYENIDSITHLKNINEKKRQPIDESIPKVYGELISKCLADNPDDRPTFSEICQDFRENIEFYKTGVDIDQYKKYIDFISSAQSGQNSAKKTPTSNESSENKNTSESKQKQGKQGKPKDDGCSNDNDDRKQKRKKDDDDDSDEEDKDKDKDEKEDEEEEEEEEENDDDDDENVEGVESCKEKLLEILRKNDVEFVDINKYLLEKFLDYGTYGNVYKAIKKVKGKKGKETFAAKIFYTNFFAFKIDNPIVVNFLQEIIFLSKLSHPSIIKFKGYSPRNFKENRKEKQQVMFTEFVTNGSLRDIIKKIQNGEIDNFDDTNKLIIIYGIAQSMSHLHAQNILHRDLKPENILVDQFFHPKLADFGLSIKLTGDHFIGTDSVGTVNYMAPEVFDKRYSKAADVYAFGILVFELINENFAFQCFSEFQIQYHICILKKRLTFKKNFPIAYKELITRCWTENEAERPTFNEIVSSLKTDPEFISGKIDEEKYRTYIQMIDEQVKTIKTSEIVIKT